MYGPQRSDTGGKGKGKVTQRGEKKHNCAEPLPEDVEFSWEQTKDRFVWELLQIYYFRPTGGSINPEVAFAHTRSSLEGDLHLSVSDVFYRDRDHHPTNLLLRR